MRLPMLPMPIKPSRVFSFVSEFICPPKTLSIQPPIWGIGGRSKAQRCRAETDCYKPYGDGLLKFGNGYSFGRFHVAVVKRFSFDILNSEFCSNWQIGRASCREGVQILLVV